MSAPASGGGGMSDYLTMLEHSHAMADDFTGHERTSRLDFLGDHVFNFTTYDSEMSELFARKAIEVCKAISGKITYDYIADPENYRWYLLMVNMPFFDGRLEWGCSIRGAWWVNETTILNTVMLFDGDEQIQEPRFTADEWWQFIAAVVVYGERADG